MEFLCLFVRIWINFLNLEFWFTIGLTLPVHEKVKVEL